MATENEVEAFLEAALERGLITHGEADECRKIADVLRDIAVDMPVSEVVVRKRYLSKERATEVERALAERRVGRYEVLERLGTGAMGVVWRARDTKLDRIVALKVLARDAMKKKAVRERFHRESRIALQLNHVNIVRGLAFGDEAGYTFLALEFVPGETLAQVLKRQGHLPQAEALKIGLDLVKALEHLAKFNLVHRDIKPDNVILTPDGQVKLCDLGLTRPALLEASELGVEEEAIGTPTYVSPEQIQRPDHIDWRADLYSLGCTLYHALTGQPPFVAEDALTLTRMQVEKAARDPREHQLGLSEGTATLVLKMLHKEPAKRYESLELLEEDLRAVMDGGPATHALSAAPVRKPAAEIHRTTRVSQVPRARKSSALPIAVTLGGVAIAVVIAVGMMGEEPPASPPPDTGTNDPAPVDPPPAEPDPDADPEPDPEPTVDPREAAALQALGIARDYRSENPQAFLETHKRLEFVTERYADTEAGKAATALLETVESERRAAGVAELDRRRELAAAAEGEGRLLDAWTHYTDFPLEFDDTPAAAESTKEAGRVAAAALERVEAAERAIPPALEAFKLQEAADAFATLDGAALPALRDRIDDLGETIDTRGETYDTLRERQRPGFEAHYAASLFAAVRGDAAPGAGDVDLSVYGDELAQLDADRERVGRVLAAALAGWQANKGATTTLHLRLAGSKPVEGRAAGSRDGKLAIRTSRGTPKFAPHQVVVEDIVALASGDLDGADGHYALLMYALANPDVEAAVERLELLRLARGPVAEAEAKIEWVRAHLDRDIADRLRRAELARRQDQLPEALRELEGAVEIRPSHAGALVALGRVLVDSGRPDDAVPLLERAFELPDAPRDARLWLAHALAADGELEGAQKQYRAVLARLGADDPLRADAEAGLGKATSRLNATVVKKLSREADKLFRRKEWRAAEPVYTRILALVPDDADASFRLGQSYARQNKLFAAYRRLTVFTREHPKHSRMSEALKELAALERYRRINADDRETAKNAGLALNEARFEEAADLYRKALAWSPFYEFAHRGRVRALLALHEKTGTDGDLARAVEALDDLLFLVPEDDALLTTRARALLELGELDRAARDAEAAAAGDPGSVEPVLLAGNARLKLGDLERAARHFEEAQRRTPSAEALYGMGLVHEQGGYMRNALRAFTSALEGFEVDPVMSAKLMEAARRVRAAIDSESR